MRIESVGRDADDLHPTGFEVLLPAGNLAKLGSAHLIDRDALRLVTEHTSFVRSSETYRSEISGVREQDSPGVTEPLVELDRALGSLRREIRSNAARARGSEAEQYHSVLN